MLGKFSEQWEDQTSSQRDPAVFSPCLWEPQVSLPFRPPLVLSYTPFPSLWREGVWMLGSPPHLPLLFTVPSHDLWRYKRPRLLLKPEMHLHSL